MIFWNGHSRETGGNPTPIKSSLSVILKKDQIWTNYATDSSRTSGVTQSGVGSCGGDFTGMSSNFDIAAFRRNMKKESFDTFTERLVQRHTKKKRIADRKALSKSKICKVNDRRTKKSRQVFTFSRPTSYQPPSGRGGHNEDIEIYESSGGSGTYKETWQPSIARIPAENGPSPQVRVLPRVALDGIDPYDSNSSCDTQIFFPERLLTPNHLPGTCFPRAKSQPDLYYSISDQSMPLKHYTSAHNIGDIFKNCGLINWQTEGSYFLAPDVRSGQKIANKTIPAAGISPRMVQLVNGSSGLDPRKSLTTYPKEDQYGSEIKNSETFFRGCQELNDFLSTKMTKTLTGISILPTRGRLMNYAKFNSSFKITEDYYEDVNCRSASRVPKVAESLAGFPFRGPDRNLEYIHKLNPDFDENQSLTEALTAIRSPNQSSSLTSVAMRSELIAKVYEHFAKSANKESPDKGRISWTRTPETEMKSEVAFRLQKNLMANEFFSSSAVSQLDQKSEFLDFSNDTGSCVSLSRVVSAIRKQRLTELKISLKNPRNHQLKETDLWSSATLSPVRSDPSDVTCGEPVSPMKLCDVISQTGVFNNSSVELFKRPLWKFKMSSLWDVRRSKLAQEFVSKAHHYMCGKDYHRATLNRCFFRRTPALRLSDQTTQFPELNPTSGDRLVVVEKPEEEILSVEAATYCQIVHEKCHLVNGANTEQNSDRSLEGGFNFGCSNAYHCQTFATKPIDPSTGYGSCHKRMSSVSFTEINCVCPSANATVYCTGSDRLAKERPNLVHAEPAFGNATADSHDQSSLLGDLEGPDSKPKPGHISHSFRALCDKRRIRIKYEDGKYTVYKEVDRTRRRTVWSLLTGKATNLLSSSKNQQLTKSLKDLTISWNRL
ncbi:hypothetical protein GE061_006184 [Apolygus lucorum]|uniref:Uncharacterized protein n=1 Tax=Apolygus lucorum TaxID=248454 RepID=A0A8S9WVQ1_APOLU|nr:hypothetical protein GE061_006184 [Apolygus lucorum]